ncbi:MAG: methionyl-tRNA formyltransferase [Acidobacteriaceae bacterium]|nr:methionyl-tRNA formyltransferase [Acidobacteriaceae bacterium]MBV9781724.1 methionyl-tRNA formyltransferase [Acidobacteriaceae bacterium]
MRVVFLGTPEFAVPSLETLISSGHEVVAVFTQPDRPKGRGKELTESPVKIAVRSAGLTIYQPERIRRPENLELLKSLAPELMIVVGYGQIIPQSIIDTAARGILNVHASLLPKYRGAAPIQWAIANGETETGVTIMQIDAGLDTGDMLLKAAVPIEPDETAPELSVRLARLGAQLLIRTVEQMIAGTVRRERQDDTEATYAPILKKQDGLVDWSLNARQIYNRLRGFTPWPGAYTMFRGQQLLILKARIAEDLWIPSATLKPEKRRLFAGCGGNSTLELLELQLSGNKRMPAQAFLNGYKPAEHERLGD